MSVRGALRASGRCGRPKCRKSCAQGLLLGGNEGTAFRGCGAHCGKLIRLPTLHVLTPGAPPTGLRVLDNGLIAAGSEWVGRSAMEVVFRTRRGFVREDRERPSSVKLIRAVSEDAGRRRIVLWDACVATWDGQRDRRVRDREGGQLDGVDRGNSRSVPSDANCLRIRHALGMRWRALKQEAWEASPSVPFAVGTPSSGPAAQGASRRHAARLHPEMAESARYAQDAVGERTGNTRRP
jgi:hypothetical protein